MTFFRSNSFTCGGLFAGIGGFCSGFESAGFTSIWASDSDERVAQTYLHNFPGTHFVLKDILKLDASSLPEVDVLHAGFPCQSFSAAGNRMGFNDPRGRLFDTMLDLIENMPIRPKVLLFENATNLLSGDGGAWFDHVKRRIKKAGYWFNDANALRISSHDHFGLPQKRERLFMIATNRDIFDFNPFTYLPEKCVPKGLLNYIREETVNDPKYYLASDNRYGEWLLREGGDMAQNQLIQLRQHIVRKQEPDICPTLTANMGGGGHNVPFLMDRGKLRKLTERECLNLQGFPREFSFPEELPSSSKYKQIGNSVCPLVSEWLAKQIITFFREEAGNDQMAI
ncbi:DNA (cytosine-5-)-methyltransferase [bacterium]|nr:DNA (cytosine-5-)-methyltransferase [bacterium]